jgi:hypothetical protein
MMSFAKLACPAAVLAALTFAAPAHAQFGGMDMSQMQQQFTPMLEMMKQKMGKKRFGQLMQTMGPMMSQMMDGQGGGGGGGGMGGFGGGAGGFDMSQMMSMMGSMKGLMGGGGRRHKSRRHHS